MCLVAIEFVATVLPCIGIVVGRIKSTTNQSRSIEQQVKNLEKTAAAVGKGARDGVRVTHQVNPTVAISVESIASYE